jgi:hypothetical protein
MVIDNVTIALRILARLERSTLVAADDPFELAEALGMAVRAAHVLGQAHLLKIEQELPAGVQSMMELPETSLDAGRDAFVEPLDYLSFVDILDAISDDNLECVAPHLHRGWQDKKESCRNARRATKSSVGFSIGFSFRESLLQAAAIYNRVFLVPAPVELEINAVKTAVSSVLQLIENLVPKGQKAAFAPLLLSLQK